MNVSVVIPCHNGSAYIEQCIKSVVEQTDYNSVSEILVVDDGSTDDSPQILNRLKLDLNQLKIITTEKLGVSAARNTGIKLAQSDFIALLDSDDYWTKNKLQNQLKAFNNNSSIGLVYGDFWNFSKPEAIDAVLVVVKSFNHDLTNQLDEYFIKDGPIIPSTTIFRKEVFKTVGFFNEDLKVYEDTEMYLRVAEKWKLFYVKGGFCYKRRSPGQITQRLEKLLHNQDIVSQIIVLRNPHLKKFVKRRASRNGLKAAIDCLIIHGEKQKALSHVIKSLKLNPFNLRSWIFMIMIFTPYNITLKIYTFTKSKFYQLRNLRNKEL